MVKNKHGPHQHNQSKLAYDFAADKTNKQQSKAQKTNTKQTKIPATFGEDSE